jgi:hypothetical protein
MKTTLWDSFNAEGVDVSVEKANSGVVFVLRYKTVAVDEVVGEIFDCPHIERHNVRSWFFDRMAGMDPACHCCSEFSTCSEVLTKLRTSVVKWLGIDYADFLDGVQETQRRKPKNAPRCLYKLLSFETQRFPTEARCGLPLG